VSNVFQPVSYGAVLLVFGLMSLGPGTQSLGLEHLNLDNKCATTCSVNLVELLNASYSL